MILAGFLCGSDRSRSECGARRKQFPPLVAIQEAGLEGFWIHRVLTENDIESHVVDPASVATSRRRRRAKTDKLDGDTLICTLLPTNAVSPESAQWCDRRPMKKRTSADYLASAESYGMARPSLRRRRLAGVQEEEEAMANVLETISVLGIDLGKNVCSVVGLDASGAVVLRRRAKRETLLMLAAKLPPCIVAMEACCGAHHLGRVFAAHDHDVRLMSPEYVRPYVKAQKNDDRDAEGIAEAATRPTMRFVELKSQDQLDMQTLHRSRDRLVGERTALINQLRAILLERGLVAPQGKRKLEQFLAVLMDEQGGAGMSPRMVLLIADARTQWAELDRRIAAFDAEFVRWAKENEDARRLATSPGLVRSSRLRLSPRLGERRASSEVVISRPGSAWSLGSSPPAANRSCSGSASEATNTCADS